LGSAYSAPTDLYLDSGVRVWARKGRGGWNAKGREKESGRGRER